jgi:UrcA family protein
MNLTNRKRCALAGAAVLCTLGLVFSGGAFADTTTTESLRVSYVSAELTTPEGVRELYARIRRAARVVCHEPLMQELASDRGYQQCFDRAVADAVAKVNSEALTALHRRRSPEGTAG